ncbi:MAG: hypothetical protein J1F35_05820 [Erysipelotrichales bacterium]|nr:hypothetical protein [Erysipelotrichales bacterium]
MAQYDFKLFQGLIVDDILDAAIQELDVMFGTEETELLGDYSYGVNFEQFLWTMSPSPSDVDQYLLMKIHAQTYFCNLLDVHVNTEVMQGTLRDIYVVKISIMGNNGNLKPLKNWMFK